MKYLTALFVIASLVACSGYVTPKGVENAVKMCESHGGLKYVAGSGARGTSMDSFEAICEDGFTIQHVEND